jgi:nucleoside-diphosphate-sugar epimerase
MIEEPARGKPFTVWVEPESVLALLWYQDAARAAVELAAAPLDSITSINYLVDGPRPTPSAGELADAVRLRIPDAQITFEPEPDSPAPRHIILDDRAARDEWGWQHRFDVDAMIDGIIAAQ